MFRTLWRKWLGPLSPSSRRGRAAGLKPVRRRTLALVRLEDRTVPTLFNAPLIANLPAFPLAEATGHFRGANAPLDAVTVSRDGTVSVLLGNGDGTFQAPENIRLGTNAFTNSVAVGDLGNGHPDIVVGNGNGTVDVLLGNGDGTFQAPEVLQVGGTAGGVALGDFLGNGRQDIVLVRARGTVSVLLNNGDGTFGAPIDTALPKTPFGDVTSLAVGDFNHDGRDGLAVSSDAGVEVLRGNGDGTFALENTIHFGVNSFDHTAVGTFQVQTADLRGNGETDLVVVTGDNVIPEPNNDVRVLLGNGDGTFQTPVVLHEGAFDQIEAVAVGDFTGDGKADVATLNFGHLAGTPFAPNLDVWAGNGDGTFRNLGVKFVGGAPGFGGDFLLTAGDFRGDGKLDLLTGGRAKAVTLFLGNGDGTFNLAPTFAAGFSPAAIAGADFTGSGRPRDLVVANSSGSVSVLLGNGDGTFRSPVSLFGAASQDTFDGMAVGDFLGNGKQDVAVAVTDLYSSQNSVLIFLGNGDGTFQRTPLTPTLPGGFTNTIQSLAASDLNSDGKADLIVTSTQASFTQPLHTGVVSVFLGNGDGTFQAPENFSVSAVTFPVSAAVSDLTVADLRGDGKLDLIVTVPAASGQSAVEALLGNGDGTFQAPVTVFTGAGGKLAVGDFLGNGRQDILTYTTNGTLNVLVSNGDGTFGSTVTTTTGLGLGGVAVGDFVGNGHLGLAFTATDTGGVIVLQGGGDGTFQLAGDFLAGLDQGRSSFAPMRALVAGDFNGDGKLDLITADYGPGGFGPGTVTVLLNQGSTTAAPPTLQSTVVNDGTGQDPAARSLTVTFSAAVTLSDGALEVRDAAGNDVPLSVSTAVVNGRTVATVTFTGGNLVGGALPTGSYTLTAHSALIHDGLGQPLQQINGADPTFAFTSTVTAATAPTVTAVRLNEGAPAPANVSSITLHFSGLVNLGAGAVEVLQQGGGAVGLSVAVGVEGGNTVAVLTFTGGNLVDGALPDGAYTLVLHGGQITDGQGQALGGAFAGDNAADFTAADGAAQPGLVALFHPLGGA
jgi:hypothetical protein